MIENDALDDKNEWSHFIDSDKIDVKPHEVKIEANTAQRKALCHRLGVQEIKHLSAGLTVQRNQVNKSIEIEGKITADLTQSCVITADSVEEHVEEVLQAWYADTSGAVSLSKAKRDRLPDIEKAEQPIIEEVDDPEPVINGKIDLGELVTQHLSLSLNPYPRAKNAEWPETTNEDDEESALYDNPFAALKEWKANEQKKAGKKDKKDKKDK